MEIFRLLPLTLVYGVSWCFYVLGFYIVKYRKSVVLTNLRCSFPEKDEKEIRQIAKKFYKYFCNMLGESIKGFTLSKKQLLKRYRVVNPEFMNEMFLQNKSVMALGGHYGNIEWGKVLGLQLMHPVFVVFSPFTNTYVNNYNVRAREKYGVYILPVTKTLRVISERKKKPTCYMVGVDQRPFDIKNAHWTNFLNQDTPCHTGYAQIARRFNLPLVFINIQCVKRGYYTTEYLMLHPEPATLTEAEIVELFMKTLEKQIRAKPQNYLWSHKRWKFQRQNQGIITRKY